MLKKICGISLLIVIVGVLVFGAVNRTLAKSGDESVRQSGSGRGSGQIAATSEQTSAVYSQGNCGKGQGGNGRHGRQPET